MKHLKLMSMWLLLMMFTLCGYASVPLTNSGFVGYCDYNLNTDVGSGGTAYGNGSVLETDYIDLSAYSQLLVTVASTQSGNCRMFFNCVGADANKSVLEVNKDNYTNYGTLTGNTYIIDLAKVKAATQKNYVHLNAIKNWFQNSALNIKALEVSEENYAQRWDFTVDGSTTGLSINHDGNASNWVYESGTGYKVQRGVNVTVTIPQVAYGNVVKITLTNAGGHNNNKVWNISGAGINEGGNGANAAGEKTITIPAEYASPTNLVLTLKGYNAGDWIGVSKIEVIRTPITWNIDNGNYLDANNQNNIKDKLNNDNPIVVPVRNMAGSAWSVNPRFKISVNGSELTNASSLLCQGTFNANYFNVKYSENGILTHTAIGETSNKPRIEGLSAASRGEVAMTFTYNGSQGYAPYSKTYYFEIEGIPCQIVPYDKGTMINSYEKYLDEGEWRNWFMLRTVDGDALSFDENSPCTVVKDEIPDEVNPDIITLGEVKYMMSGNTRILDVHQTPNLLGTETLIINYPGDNIYEPAVYYYDVNIIQHMIKLEWVDSNGDETDEWITNQNIMYNGIPTLTKYKDNEADNSLSVSYKSTNEAVATIDANGNVTFKGPGMTVITATFNNTYKTENGLNYYYNNDESASYTMILEEMNVQGDEPHIVWITGSRYEWSFYGQNAAGSYLGRQWVNAENSEYRAMSVSELNSNNYPYPKNYVGYGNDFFVSAVALKSSITDAQLESAHIFKITGYKDHYYVRDDANNQWWTNAPTYGAGTWRANLDIPEDYLFDKNDKFQNRIQYMVDKPDMVRTTLRIDGDGNNFNEGLKRSPTSIYKVTPAYASQDSLKIYAFIKGYNNFSTTKVLVNPGKLQLRFVPEYGTVNGGTDPEVDANNAYSISPYVNCPDLRLEDVTKIWMTYDCPTVVKIPNDGVVYEAGKTSHADIAKYLVTVTANDTIWINSDAENYNADGTPKIANIRELRPTTWLRGINPEIFGLSTGIDNTCKVTLHLESEMYETATASYDVTVIGDANTKTMFHFEMNDNGGEDTVIESGDDCKVIALAEGDFIYMPGIIGNSNGNNDYSKVNQYRYMYAFSNGNIIMSYAKYFPGEGVPNYYLANTFGGSATKPESGARPNQPAIVTWSHGLGNYWRNDTLMIYGNQPGEMYLYAQDPQTKLTCSPIKIVVVSRDKLVADKQEELGKMTYPFTWDFENMDLTKYIADAENSANGNGGTYWRKQWDEQSQKERDEARENGIYRGYNRDYKKETKYYQYNGGMNADWDDKDENSSSRQRWFKDIYSTDGNGSIEYAPEFKGIMLNLSGLDYWEQKFQRFGISSDPDDKFIIFRGGPIFVQLPGFGLLDKKTGQEENPGTRSFDNYIGGNDKTKGWHNHINTAGYNVNEGYTQMLSVDNTKNKDVTYPVQPKYRNNKVRFVIKAQGNPNRHNSDNEVPNLNESSQFHIGGASMINEDLDINDINWNSGVHKGYSYYNIAGDEPKVYIVELDPYDPELQDHIYLMFNNDVKVYWMAITNEPRNILSDFDGVTYSYPKDIDMEKTNLTLGMQTKEGIYTKADANGNYKIGSENDAIYTKKNVYQVGSTTPGEGTKVQLKAYTVSKFYPVKEGNHLAQSVSLEEIKGNIPKNEGVMLYTEPRMSTLANNPTGLEAATYNRGTTVYSEPYQYTYKNEEGEWVTTTKYHWYTATSGKNNIHDYYYLPLYFIAQAENMSALNYAKTVPESTYGGLEASAIPVIDNNHVVTPNLLRPTTYGQVLSMDSRTPDQDPDVINDGDVIHFGYNNEFICRNLIYVNEGQDQTKVMDIPYITRPDGAYEDLYYYEIGIEFARFYRINSPDLNHHNRSAYMTLTWDEYKVNTEGKPLSITTQGSNQVPKFVRFSSTSNPIDIKFDGANDENLVSEDGGFPDGINEIEQSTGDVKAYNLNGIRVNGLSKGVYIINGKKVVVK